MVRQLVVRPFATGWCVEGDAPRLQFASGARAEEAARRLARGRAEAGETAEVRIMLRDGSVAGVFRFEADAALFASA